MGAISFFTASFAGNPGAPFPSLERERPAPQEQSRHAGDGKKERVFIPSRYGPAPFSVDDDARQKKTLGEMHIDQRPHQDKQVQ